MAIVLIAGQTQSGKGELARQLVRAGNFERVFMHTDGTPLGITPYIHISSKDMTDMHNAGLFFEMNTHANRVYGLTKKALLKAVDSPIDQILVLSPKGVDKVRKYLNANAIPSLAIFLSIPTLTSVERLTEKMHQHSLSKSRFIHKMATLALHEKDWSKEAYTGNTFDIVFEIAEGHSLELVSDAVCAHITALNSHVKKMAKAV